MNRTQRLGLRYALALVRDAIGNGLNGQEERSMRYLVNAGRVLIALEAAIDSKDVRKERELEQMMRDTDKEVDSWTPWNPELMSSAREKWEKLGIDDREVLVSLSKEQVEELMKHEVSAKDYVEQMTPEQAKGLFEAFVRQGGKRG